MWRVAVVAASLAFSTTAACADGQFATDKGFSCGRADVRFVFAKRGAGGEVHVATVMTVGRDGHETVLQYDNNIDFIGGVCIPNKSGKPMVVFQAYCGGSGCADLDNWGIVDPADLRVLLVPNDWNRGDAEKILGHPLPVDTDERNGRQLHMIDIKHMHSVTIEAAKLGLKWPSP